MMVLLLPLVIMYGAAFFLTWLEQIDITIMEYKATLRFAAVAGFVLIMCLPALGRRFGDKVNPVAYPPYYPPEIQVTAGWMKENELYMSDVPWAVAWYGHRQCVWLTLNAKEDFYAVNDLVKPVRALYLTPETLDLKLVSECVQVPANSWGSYVLKKATTDDSAFPLRFSPPVGVINSGLFVTDRARWLGSAP